MIETIDNSSNFNTVECPDGRPCYNDVDDSNKWVDSLPNSHLIVILIDQGKMENKEKLCDYCTRQKRSESAVSWCPECCDRLCENCVKFHHVNRLTMEHQVCNLEEQEQKDKFEVDLFFNNIAAKD